MIIRRRVFRHGLMRSLGARLANFSRVRTDRYTHPAGEPPEASPIWQEAAERPLVWKLPTGAVPQVGPFESETPSAPAIGPDLLAIMHDHAERRALEREQDQPRLAQAPELPASSATPVQAEATRQRPMASSRRQGAPQAPAQASGAPLTRRRPMPGLLEEVTPSQAARSQASEAQGPPAVSLSAPLPAASEPALQPTTVAEPSDAPTYPEPVAPPWDDGVLVESPKPEAAADEIEASSAQLKTPDV